MKVLSSSALTVLGVVFGGLIPTVSIAQTNIAPCQPPEQGTYLLLVDTPNFEQQNKLVQSLSSNQNININLCQYQDKIVSRIGSFPSIEVADQMGQYITQELKLTAVIARPAGTQTPIINVPIHQNSTTSTSPIPNFKPTQLGQGYAILVDYFHQPDVSIQVANFLNKKVGLAVYLSRPYLLVSYTQNQEEAQKVLQALTEQGFWATIVNSKNVIRLTEQVQN